MLNKIRMNILYWLHCLIVNLIPQEIRKRGVIFYRTEGESGRMILDQRMTNAQENEPTIEELKSRLAEAKKEAIELYGIKQRVEKARFN